MWTPLIASWGNLHLLLRITALIVIIAKKNNIKNDSGTNNDLSMLEANIGKTSDHDDSNAN